MSTYSKAESSKERKDNYDYLFKVSLIGDSSCGKTSIMLRFTDNVFYDNLTSTIGVDFKVVGVKIDETLIKLQIWDTCGSERFLSLTSSFIKTCQVFILVFDLTNYESFKNIERWLCLIKESTDPKLMILVGNKSDIFEKREVSKEEILQMADKYQLNYVEVSAKTSEGVYEIFSFVAETLLRNVKRRKNTGCSTDEQSTTTDKLSQSNMINITQQSESNYFFAFIKQKKKNCCLC